MLTEDTICDAQFIFSLQDWHFSLISKIGHHMQKSEGLIAYNKAYPSPGTVECLLVVRQATNDNYLGTLNFSNKEIQLYLREAEIRMLLSNPSIFNTLHVFANDIKDTKDYELVKATFISKNFHKFVKNATKNFTRTELMKE